MRKLLAVMVLILSGMIQASPIAAWEEHVERQQPTRNRRHSHPEADRPERRSDIVVACGLVLSGSWGIEASADTKPAEKSTPEPGGTEEELGVPKKD